MARAQAKHPAERFATRIAGSRGRAFTVLTLMVLTAVLSLAWGRRIHIDTNLEALLSRDAPAVAALNELRSRQDATDRLYIAVKSDDYAANRALTEAIADRVRAWPEAVAVVTQRDFTPIRDHALYFLDLEELRELRDELQQQRKLAIARRTRPGLTEDDDIALDQVLVGDDWDADPSALSEPEPDGPEQDERSVRDILDDYRAKLEQDPRVPERSVELIWPEENEQGEIEWKPEVGKPLVSPSGKIHLVEARLSQPATDLQFTRTVSKRVDTILEQLDPTSFAPDMMVKIGGPYMASREADTIIRDLQLATSLSALLVATVLILGFRSLRGLFIVLLPIGISCAYTLAIAELLLGELNALTAFLFAVLLGIGVDFAVHLQAIREAQGAVPDWAKVLREHFRPLAASMVTTVGSFLVLLLADFKAFREFGLIAATGVAVSFVVALIVVPSLDVALGPMRRKRARSSRGRLLVGGPSPGLARGFRIGVVSICLGMIAIGAPQVRFERDLRQLRAPETKSQRGIAYSRALGNRSGTPIAVIADDAATLDESVSRLQADRETSLVPADSDKRHAGRPWIREVVSLSLHMPDAQRDKYAIIREIEHETETMLGEVEQQPDNEELTRYRTHLHALHELASESPLRREELPPWTRAPFLERTGHDDRLALVYTRLQPWDLDQVVAVTRRFRELTEGLDVRGASSRFVLADLAVKVERDAKRLPPYALGMILLLIGLDLRRIVPTMICFSVLALGLGLTFGIMGIWPIRINFYNLVVMPAVIGLGIDATIHLWHARALGAVPATAKAAMVSGVTTAGGFAGLLIAGHRGLQSIGRLGVVATLSCVVVAVLLLSIDRLRSRDLEPR